MTDVVDQEEVEQELTPEQEAAETAAFEAAFNGARSNTGRAEGTLENDAEGKPLVKEEAAKPNEEDTAKAEADAQAEAAAKAAADAAAEENAPVAVTKSELAALRAVAGQVATLQDELRRSNDSTAGRIGSLKQTLDAVKEQAKQGIKPSALHLKRLTEEFPQLGEMLKADLEEAFGPGEAAPAAAADAPAQDEGKEAGAPAPAAAPEVDPLANPVVQKQLQALEMKIVEGVHPDWRNLKATPEFATWRNNLPAAAQQLLGSTWDSNVLKDAFADFKSWNTRRLAAADANKQRDKRMADAIPATAGTQAAATAVDDDDAFLSGFKRAKGNR